MQTDEPLVDILMATYNGAAALPSQLASIAAQTYRNWKLIVRDDGSKDDTLGILAEFSRQNPGKLVLINDALGNLGPLRNFATLLVHSDADYIGFSDHDDIWDREKLALSISELRLIEEEHGSGVAALVVTDRRVVDDIGTPIAASFWENQGIQPRNIHDPFDYFFHPVAAGSSMLMNQSLRDLVQPIPDTAIMYDCWIELVAARFAKTRYIEKAMLLYVKHAGNASGGGRAYGANRYIRRARFLLANLKRQRAVYRRMLGQARSYLAAFGDRLSEAERKRVECLLAMEGAGIAKLWLAPRAAGLPPTWERKLAFLLLV